MNTVMLSTRRAIGARVSSLRVTAAAGAVAVFTLLLVGPWSAPATADTKSYPPSSGCNTSVQLSSDRSTVVVNGTGFAADSAVSIGVKSGGSAQTTTNSSGSFSQTIALGSDGSGPVTSTGEGCTSVTDIDLATAADPAANAGSTSNGLLASTGAQVGAGVLFATVLLAGGTVLTRLGRSRKV
jgi:hypothetical protein